jgi:hypothetical protein
MNSDTDLLDWFAELRELLEQNVAAQPLANGTGWEVTTAEGTVFVEFVEHPYLDIEALLRFRIAVDLTAATVNPTNIAIGKLEHIDAKLYLVYYCVLPMADPTYQALLRLFTALGNIAQQLNRAGQRTHRSLRRR